MSADRGGTTIDALCRQIHKTLISDFQYSLVWGTSSKHYPQRQAPQLCDWLIDCLSSAMQCTCRSAINRADSRPNLFLLLCPACGLCCEELIARQERRRNGTPASLLLA